MVSKKECAHKRIRQLFDQAQKMYSTNPELSHRYVKIAWRIALKVNTQFTKKQKIKFCRNCKSYLQPGKNVTYRLNKGMITKKCKECNNIRRYRYK